MKKIITIVSLAIASLFVGAHYASAMASIFMAPTKTATATTTLAWITAGTGTTTVTLPTPLALGMATKYDKAYVMFEASATSSTASGAIINYRVEHSLDGVDWFSEPAYTVANATSTSLASQEFKFNIATSTAYNNNNVTNRVHQSFYFETPTPYNRVVFYVPVGGNNVSLWAAVQPIKEVQVINQ